MSLFAIGVLLICIFLFSVCVYMAVAYWRASSLPSDGVFAAYNHLWWNQRTVVYIFLGLWVLIYIVPIGFFLLYCLFTGADPINALARIIQAGREDHLFMWSIANILAGVTAMAVVIRLALSRINAPKTLLIWCAKNYATAIAITAVALLVLAWLWNV